MGLKMIPIHVDRLGRSKGQRVDGTDRRIEGFGIHRYIVGAIAAEFTTRYPRGKIAVNPR